MLLPVRSTRRTHRQRASRAAAAVELAICLPLMVLMVLGSIEVSHAIDRDSFALTQGYLQHDRNQMRFGVVVFTDSAIGMSARGIEVTQRRAAETIGGRVIGQRMLDDQLGKAVRVDRSGW